MLCAFSFYKDVIKSLSNLIEENGDLQKQLQSLLKAKAQSIKQKLLTKVQNKNGINFIAEKISFDSAEEIKNILFEIRNQVENCVCVVGAEVKGKPSISVIID